LGKKIVEHTTLIGKKRRGNIEEEGDVALVGDLTGGVRFWEMTVDGGEWEEEFRDGT